MQAFPFDSSEGNIPVDISQYLLPADAERLKMGSDVVLHDPAEVDKWFDSKTAKQFVDPVLANSSRCDHTVGLFFVPKKSGKLRLILGAECANVFFNARITVICLLLAPGAVLNWNRVLPCTLRREMLQMHFTACLCRST